MNDFLSRDRHQPTIWTTGLRQTSKQMLSSVAALVRAAAQYALPKTAFRLALMRKIHDEAELDLLPYLVESAQEAIDVGANVGRYASRLATLSEHVHVFEPHPRLARMLMRSLPRNCTVYQTAASDTYKEVRLSIPLVDGRQDEGLAFVGQRAALEQCVEVAVDAVPLDKLADRPIGFIKIDVEGHEDSVLQGSIELIYKQRPVVLVEAEERHCSGAVQFVISFFAQYQYRGFFFLNGKLNDIDNFRYELQDAKSLAEDGGSRSRNSKPYINNFVFVPTEKCMYIGRLL